MRMPSGVAAGGVRYERDGVVVRVVGSHVGRVRAPRDVGVRGGELDALIVRQREFFRARGEGVEWKVRDHDVPGDLAERLVAAGFVAGPPAAVLIGFADEVAEMAGVASASVVPDGVIVRRAAGVEDFRRIAEQQTEVWGFDCSWVAADLAGRVEAAPEEITILVAQAGERFVCTAWSVYERGTEFVALLGGTTVPQWQGRGLYRALLAERAREASARGFRLLHVDASADSAPILRRAGFHEIAASRHYQWSPSGVGSGDR
ncbi:GNAT family N-acetyltransferase [Actinoplanes couchii]|uniref:N-acetyltransferase domain-containing protein n=1 Tax=Actinoplanes couchii TaxID=403638 RepID=A0ABQ3XLS8_9ACTN|nr:GNAT family N-acetyltransferase [Actinoplanes couchii]MDR6319320.1 GNAT superfamily N-acetyltransferase [Actinoplanes couchii]GID59470.1 hypothetical protein Aco03nite_078740 [Actinoplanes couchii]